MRRRLSYANVMATIAVFLALGGTTYAATRIGTNQIRNGAVTNAKLAQGAVTGGKVKNRSLLAKDFKLGQLPRGPRGPAGVRGPRGLQGPAGSLTGAAGGDLSGSYPNPQIRANRVGSAEIVTNGVGSSEIATNAVGAAEIAANAVATDEIAADAVGTAELAPNAVSADKLAPGGVGSAAVTDHGVRLIDVTVASAAFSLDPAAIAADDCLAVTQTTTGTAAGDVILLVPPADLEPALYASVPRTVAADLSFTFQVCNPSAVSVNGDARSWTYHVLR